MQYLTNGCNQVKQGLISASQSTLPGAVGAGVSYVTTVALSQPAKDIYQKLPKIGEKVVSYLPSNDWVPGVRNALGRIFLIDIAYRSVLSLVNKAEAYAIDNKKFEQFRLTQVKTVEVERKATSVLGGEKKPIRSIEDVKDLITGEEVRETTKTGYAVQAAALTVASVLVVTVASLAMKRLEVLSLETLKQSAIAGAGALVSLNISSRAEALYSYCRQDKYDALLQKASANYYKVLAQPLFDKEKLVELEELAKNSAKALTEIKAAVVEKENELGIGDLKEQIEEITHNLKCCDIQITHKPLAEDQEDPRVKSKIELLRLNNQLETAQNNEGLKKLQSECIKAGAEADKNALAVENAKAEGAVEKASGLVQQVQELKTRQEALDNVRKKAVRTDQLEIINNQQTQLDKEFAELKKLIV